MSNNGVIQRLNLTYIIVLMMFLQGCQPAQAPAEWLGRWNGPEGTFLEIAQRDKDIVITVSDLDGPQFYTGVMKGNYIVFERNGVQETIRPGNGADTGMKWLAQEENCLVIKAGEGFCRD